MTLSKTELLKKAAALKKMMLQKSKCCVEVVKEVRRISFFENKAVFKKSLNMPEGKSPIWEKKIKILNCTSDYVSLELSSPRGSLTLISIHGESHANTCQGCWNQLSLCPNIFGNV